MIISPKAGKPADPSVLADIPRLLTAYYVQRPDPEIPGQRVSFGTSGHRGSALEAAFNEWHILAITQAICLYRKRQRIDGPLFLGIDTHALSEPAFASALEVLAANDVDVMIAAKSHYTPTPTVSHAIVSYNRGRNAGLADGIVVTPSHNPPEDGGFKYNPPHGGPAETQITSWIGAKANDFLRNGLEGVRRASFGKALRASTTHEYDYVNSYVCDIGNVVDMDVVRSTSIKLGVDPLGGAGVHYWPAIADHYGIDITTVNEFVDPTFRFMTLDWDGRIRMDPSSAYTMQRLIGLKERFDVAFAGDTDHDRHGIVTRSAGLLPPNHYLAVCIDYLFSHRPRWRGDVSVGKTVVSSSIIDRIAAGLNRRLYEVPVGFKWFVEGLSGEWLGFAGEESAGASFLRRDGTVWTTDKDAIIACLLAAEITARLGRDPGEIYTACARETGEPQYQRVDAPATPAQKAVLEKLTPDDIRIAELAGDKILQVLTHAPGDGRPIGGVKVTTRNGWFAARPSGTEEIYKVYAESFLGEDHLRRIQEEAQEIISEVFARNARDR